MGRVRRVGMRIFWGAGALVFLAVGCSAPAPTPGVGDAPVLLADWRPGLAPSHELYEPPDFVLYGDGLAVVREGIDAGVMKLVEYRLTPRRVQGLFDEADDADLFDGEDYTLDAQVADGGALVIMLRTREREHLVEIVLPSAEDSGARGEATEFAETLRPSEWAADDFSRPATPYRPGRVAVTFQVLTAAEVGDDLPRVWPLLDQEPVRSGCVVLTGADATRIQELGETVRMTTLWQHDDVAFRAWIRPLLPDEPDCRAMELRYRE